jgi:hypothetical protein
LKNKNPKVDFMHKKITAINKSKFIKLISQNLKICNKFGTTGIYCEIKTESVSVTQEVITQLGRLLLASKYF